MTSVSAAYPEAPVGDVLKAVAAELSHAQASCARLDGALGRLLDGVAPDQRLSIMQELHAVDLLHQQISAVAHFVSRLEPRPPATSLPVADALDGVTLGEVASRIRASLGAPDAAGEDASGDCDLL